MTARGWPVGEAEVEILLEPEGNVTKFTIREEPTGGAGWLLRNPLGDALTYRRNVETAARLAALAERRPRLPPTNRAGMRPSIRGGQTETMN